MILPISIYRLSDPRDGQVRYIGKSADLSRRMKEHLNRGSGGNRHKVEWIAGLRAEGLEPTVDVIETVLEDEAQERERFWIAHYRESGAVLLNAADGGDLSLRRRGRAKGNGGNGYVAVTAQLEVKTAEWAKNEPGGLSAMVRQFLREEKARREREGKERAA